MDSEFEELLAKSSRAQALYSGVRSALVDAGLAPYEPAPPNGGAAYGGFHLRLEDGLVDVTYFLGGDPEEKEKRDWDAEDRARTRMAKLYVQKLRDRGFRVRRDSHVVEVLGVKGEEN